MEIKFGIPSLETVADSFPNESVLTLHKLEKENSKRKFSLSKTAATNYGINPGLSKVAFSFDGDNYLAVIPETQGGIPQGDRYPVNKELSFMSKKAYDFICKKFELDSDMDNHFNISSITSMNGITVGRFAVRPAEVSENDQVETPQSENTELL